ncbi:hypothetical protein S83_069550 [Arachis hypogaea]
MKYLPSLCSFSLISIFLALLSLGTNSPFESIFSSSFSLWSLLTLFLTTAFPLLAISLTGDFALHGLPSP